MPATYRELDAWNAGMALVTHCYQMTRRFGPEERFGLTSQIRRAAVSIPSNIAEGEGRGSDGNLLHSLQLSYGSLRELETQLLLSKRLRLLNDADA
jgi:four helix bundle protein